MAHIDGLHFRPAMVIVLKDCYLSSENFLVLSADFLSEFLFDSRYYLSLNLSKHHLFAPHLQDILCVKILYSMNKFHLLQEHKVLCIDFFPNSKFVTILLQFKHMLTFEIKASTLVYTI